MAAPGGHGTHWRQGGYPKLAESAPNATSIVLRGEIRAGSDGGRRGESTSRTLTPRGPAEDPRADVGRGHARLGFNEAAGIPRGRIHGLFRDVPVRARWPVSQRIH